MSSMGQPVFPADATVRKGRRLVARFGGLPRTQRMVQRAAFVLVLAAASALLVTADDSAFVPTPMVVDNDGIHNQMEWLSRPTFELEGHRRSMRRAVNSVVAKGVKISVSPTTISHGGEVTIKFSNDGTEIKPKADDWIACYTPAKSDITKTVPARWQLANWTENWVTGAETSLKFKLNNFHYDYACYLFNGGLAGNPSVKSQVSKNDLSQDTGVKAGAKPFLSVQKVSATSVDPSFRVLAGPSETIMFDKPNKPTHVRVTPGTISGNRIAMTVSWNQQTSSKGGKVQFTSTPGSYTGAKSFDASSFTLNMDTDVCKGGPAGSTWGFRDMALTYQAKDIDMTEWSGKTMYYKVGDGTDTSDEYTLYVPPAPGSTDSISIIGFADQGVGYTDDSFNGRNYNNGGGALGVATNVAKDVATGKYSAVVIGGDLSYADGYLTVWEDWFDMMEPIISKVPCLVGDGNHESNWFGGDGIGSSGFGAVKGTLLPPTVCEGTKSCPQTGKYPETKTAWPMIRDNAFNKGNNSGITLGYMGDGFSQWSGSSSGGECGLIYKLMPQPGSIVGNGKADVTWWKVAYGPLTIIHYSTERDMSASSAQYLWLVETLKGIDKKATPFILAVGHRASYVDTGATKDFDIMLYYQSKLDALFSMYGVSLVMNGHTHVSQRHCSSYLGASVACSKKEGSVNAYRDPKNPVYLSVGNAGASADFWGPAPTGCDFTDWASERPAYIRINVKGMGMTINFVDAFTGQTLDTSAIYMGSFAAISTPSIFLVSLLALIASAKSFLEL